MTAFATVSHRHFVLLLLLLGWSAGSLQAQMLSMKDINPGPDGSFPGGFTVLNGALYFSADDGAKGFELWKSDGTGSGTVLVKDINGGADNSDPAVFGVLNGAIFFAADDGTNGRRLWKSDGTAGGTLLLKNITPTTSFFLSYFNFIAFDGALYFAANGELWKSDGTAGGTVLVKDINTSGSSDPNGFIVVNGTLYFGARDNTGMPNMPVFRFWKTDGTTGGTELVKNIVFGGSAVFNGELYFSASDGTDGFELWKSDGTAGGTTLVKDICPGTCQSSPSNLTVLDGALYFNASDGTYGQELWKSDGTAGGTMRLKDINPGSTGSLLSEFKVLGSTLYFTANDGVNGRELWKTDGTAGGTVLVKDIDPGPGSGTPGGYSIFNGALYFVADDGTSGGELWKTDGTAGGTELVQDINPGPDGSFPGGFTVFNGALYFSADDGVNGQELWKLGGTPLPVELTTFTAALDGEQVALAWQTASETNNAGFEVERRNGGMEEWTKVGFVEGRGTTTAPQGYRFTDTALPFEATALVYRLKQIDFDGAFEYSPEVEVRLEAPTAFALEAAYPNPFNPTTTIRYALPAASQVRLAVYDVLGREVALLLDARQAAGRHAVAFEASSLPSGVYFYRIEAGQFTQARRITLLK